MTMNVSNAMGVWQVVGSDEQTRIMQVDLEQIAAWKREREARPLVRVMPRWNRRVAGALSLVVPGLGQMYKGQTIAGVTWLVATVLGYGAFVLPGVALHACCVYRASRGEG